MEQFCGASLAFYKNPHPSSLSGARTHPRLMPLSLPLSLFPCEPTLRGRPSPLFLFLEKGFFCSQITGKNKKGRRSGSFPPFFFRCRWIGTRSVFSTLVPRQPHWPVAPDFFSPLPPHPLRKQMAPLLHCQGERMKVHLRKIDVPFI